MKTDHSSLSSLIQPSSIALAAGSAALITGASSGIGRATALEFSNRGYFVYLLGRNIVELQKTQDQCVGASEIIRCDLTKPAEINSFCLNAPKLNLKHGVKLDTVINNAGLFHRHAFSEGADDIWESQFLTNLLGPVRLTRGLFPYLTSLKGSVVINVSSTLGLKPVAGVSAYSAIKAALINWTQSLAIEGAKFGLRANCVCPGIVDTPIHDFFHESTAEKQQTMESLKDMQPLGRIGTTKEIAQSIYFLASSESGWTTGASLNVDGGIFLK